MENLWNDVIPYWNEEFIEADETIIVGDTPTYYGNGGMTASVE